MVAPWADERTYHQAEQVDASPVAGSPALVDPTRGPHGSRTAREPGELAVRVEPAGDDRLRGAQESQAVRPRVDLIKDRLTSCHLVQALRLPAKRSGPVGRVIHVAEGPLPIGVLGHPA